MRKLRDIIDIYKIAAGEAKGEEIILNKLITRTVTQARMPNLVSQLAFIFFNVDILKCLFLSRG